MIRKGYSDSPFGQVHWRIAPIESLDIKRAVLDEAAGETAAEGLRFMNAASHRT